MKCERLTSGEVHAWWTLLDQPTELCASHVQILSPDERARTARFRFPRDRARYGVGRAALRHILALYMRQPPQAIRFDYSPRGQPKLSDPAVEIEFSLAHSHGLAIIAVTRGVRVGADVERVEPLSDMEQIAASAFSPVERLAWAALPPDDRVAGFYRGWTRKEAYLKAWGDGLAVSLDSFDVSITRGKPAALLGDRLHPDAVDHWTLCDVFPVDGFVSAIAVEGQIGNPQLRQWDWQEVERF
jgi:4'-phosphopantetheinyl transferase